MKKLILVLALILHFISAGALPTLIQGNAFSYRGQSIEVRCYSDLFTYKSELLAQQFIPENGNFKFLIDIKSPAVYLLKIGKVNAHLFVMPGDEYTLVIPEPYEEDRFGPAKDIFVLPEIFESKYKLNFEITKIEQELNQFIIDRTYLYKSGGVNRLIRKPADSLIVALNDRYQSSTNQFLKDYLHYRLGEFEIMIGKSRKHVFDLYIKKQAPRYDLLSYRNLIDNFYRKIMFPGSANAYSYNLEQAIKNEHFQDIINALSEDSTLKNGELMQLIIAYQLYQLGASNTYNYSTISHLLDSAYQYSSIETIKTLSKNAKELILHLTPGTSVPELKFSDVIGNIHTLEEFSGTLIYLQFFDKFTPDVLREMSLMKVLKDGYGADVAFFSISLSESNTRLKKLSEEHGFNWFFAQATNAEGLKNDFELRSMPSYFFIDEKLKIHFITSSSTGR